MVPISRRDLLASLLVLPAALRAGEEGTSLFDGHSLDGWKVGESRDSFRIEGGKIVAAGPRGYLFYTGRGENANLKNFEFEAEVLTTPGACSGICFHTQYQPQGPLKSGFKVQIDNVYEGRGGKRDRRKTGSLYGIRNIYKPMVKDGEWFKVHIQVRDKQAQVWLNDTLIVDYVEPDPPLESLCATLSHGALALECCGPESKVYFRKLVVKPLPDDLRTPRELLPQVDSVYRGLLQMNQQGFPVVDYHKHLRDQQTVQQVLVSSRQLGIMYGIAANGGKLNTNVKIDNDADLEAFRAKLDGQPVFQALQAEGREWQDHFSRTMLNKFDYIFTDAQTFTDDKGVRMRLWFPNEVGDIPDPEQFMEMLVNRILGILNHEPIDIYVNPTYLPDIIAQDYDRLWTPARMDKVIEAAKANDVAIEISNLYRLPGPAFIQRAKDAGITFSFGTNNITPNVGRIEYDLETVQRFGLTPDNIFMPKLDGQKAIQRHKAA